MPAIQFLGDQVLFDGGVVAMDPACCCGTPCCCGLVIAGFTFTITGVEDRVDPPGTGCDGCALANISLFAAIDDPTGPISCTGFGWKEIDGFTCVTAHPLNEAVTVVWELHCDAQGLPVLEANIDFGDGGNVLATFTGVHTNCHSLRGEMTITAFSGNCVFDDIVVVVAPT